MSDNKDDMGKVLDFFERTKELKRKKQGNNQNPTESYSPEDDIEYMKKIKSICKMMQILEDTYGDMTVEVYAYLGRLKKLHELSSKLEDGQALTFEEIEVLAGATDIDLKIAHDVALTAKLMKQGNNSYQNFYDNWEVMMMIKIVGRDTAKEVFDEIAAEKDKER